MIPRRAHIKRIYGKRISDNTVDENTWIEVLRIDELGTVENHGGQVKIIRLKWNDNPSTPSLDTSTNPAREVRTVRIEAGGGSGIYFEVKAIDRMRGFESDQRFIRVFKNDTSNTARTVTRKRIYHIDADLPGSATWDEYITALEAAGSPENTSEYVDVELVGKFLGKQGPGYQADTHSLKLNDQLDDIQASATGSAARLDPFQMVVNMKTGKRYVIASVRIISFVKSIRTPERNTLTRVPFPQTPVNDVSREYYDWMALNAFTTLSWHSGSTTLSAPSSPVITNLPGIGSSYYTGEEFERFNYPAATYAAGGGMARNATARIHGVFEPNAKNYTAPTPELDLSYNWNTDGVPFHADIPLIVGGPNISGAYYFGPEYETPDGLPLQEEYEYYWSEFEYEMVDESRHGSGRDNYITIQFPTASIVWDGSTYTPKAYSVYSFPSSTPFYQQPAFGYPESYRPGAFGEILILFERE